MRHRIPFQSIGQVTFDLLTGGIACVAWKLNREIKYTPRFWSIATRDATLIRRKLGAAHLSRCSIRGDHRSQVLCFAGKAVALRENARLIPRGNLLSRLKVLAFQFSGDGNAEGLLNPAQNVRPSCRFQLLLPAKKRSGFHWRLGVQCLHNICLQRALCWSRFLISVRSRSNYITVRA